MNEFSPHTSGPEQAVPSAPLSGGTEAEALGALLDALLGPGSPELAGTVLALGGTASVGTLAWSFYKKWSRDNARHAPDGAQPAYASPERTLIRIVQDSPDATEPAADRIGDPDVARLLIRALVGACRAGGGLDDRECRRVGDAVKRLNPDPRLSALLDGFLHEPVDVDALAAQVRSRDQAQDLYRLSCALVDPDLPQERDYVNRLADALDIPAAVKEKIEGEARDTRHQRSFTPR